MRINSPIKIHRNAATSAPSSLRDLSEKGGSPLYLLLLFLNISAFIFNLSSNSNKSRKVA
jgi:hypothetical protein